MKTPAAVCFSAGKPWEVVEIDIDPPGEFEVQVRLSFAGLCHSEVHVQNGDLYVPEELLQSIGGKQAYPIVGGHEGAGVVEAVGTSVRNFTPGDHVAVNFVPSCGWCHWCATGRQNLCDLGMWALGGPMLSDGKWRYHYQGEPINRVAQLGTFSEYLVCSENSLVKIEEDTPLKVAALVSCGVTTGFGSAVYRGGVRPGEVVVVVGCGGVGSGALLGAKAAGARIVVAIDPVEFKRQHALQISATHSAPSLEEALPLVRELTRGRMADVVVLTPDLINNNMLLPAMNLASKDGRVVATAMSKSAQTEVSFSLLDLATMNKALLGAMFGSTNPRAVIPELLAMHAAGQLDVERLITHEYSLEQVNEGYEDTLEGRNIRGIIAF